MLAKATESMGGDATRDWSTGKLEGPVIGGEGIFG
jgi:hypothetical protein